MTASELQAAMQNNMKTDETHTYAVTGQQSSKSHSRKAPKAQADNNH